MSCGLSWRMLWGHTLEKNVYSATIGRNVLCLLRPFVPEYGSIPRLRRRFSVWMACPRWRWGIEVHYNRALLSISPLDLLVFASYISVLWCWACVSIYSCYIFFMSGPFYCYIITFMCRYHFWLEVFVFLTQGWLHPRSFGFHLPGIFSSTPSLRACMCL